MGFAIPLPAISGADPWTGSKRDGHLPVGLIFPDGATPIEPVHAGPRSERISPKRFYQSALRVGHVAERLTEPTTTSNDSGRSTKKAVKISICCLSSFTSG
jgi:hypothetical protein